MKAEITTGFITRQNEAGAWIDHHHVNVPNNQMKHLPAFTGITDGSDTRIPCDSKDDAVITKAWIEMKLAEAHLMKLIHQDGFEVKTEEMMRRVEFWNQEKRNGF